MQDLYKTDSTQVSDTLQAEPQLLLTANLPFPIQFLKCIESLLVHLSQIALPGQVLTKTWKHHWDGDQGNVALTGEKLGKQSRAKAERPVSPNCI